MWKIRSEKFGTSSPLGSVFGSRGLVPQPGFLPPPRHYFCLSLFLRLWQKHVIFIIWPYIHKLTSVGYMQLWFSILFYLLSIQITNNSLINFFSITKTSFPNTPIRRRVSRSARSTRRSVIRPAQVLQRKHTRVSSRKWKDLGIYYYYVMAMMKRM